MTLATIERYTYAEPRPDSPVDPNVSCLMRNRILNALIFLLICGPSAAAQTSADSAAIRQTALDYIEGWYAANADRMAKAVHGELAKRIVVRDRERTHEFVRQMGATELIEGTRSGGGSKTPAEQRRKDVTILDISYGKAASVKVVASEWVDYLHEAKVNGQWKIINVLWELTPGQ